MARFFVRLLISTLLVPFVFAFMLMPLIGLMATAVRGSGSIRASHPYVLFLGGIQIYFWGLWGAYCGSVATAYSSSPDVHRSLYYLIALGFCTAPIGWMAHKESVGDPGRGRDIQRGAVLYSIPAIVGFVTQARWPRALSPLYGWVLDWIV